MRTFLLTFETIEDAGETINTLESVIQQIVNSSPFDRSAIGIQGEITGSVVKVTILTEFGMKIFGDFAEMVSKRFGDSFQISEEATDSGMVRIRKESILMNYEYVQTGTYH